MSFHESDLLHVIMYGSKNFDNNMNISILTATIKFIKDTERFDQPLFKILLKTKNITIPSFIPLLTFFMNSVVLKLGLLP